MDLISLGIIGLVFILLIVFTVMSRNTWHWVNIVFVNLTFLAGVGASIGLAQALQLRYKAMAELDSAEKQADQKTKEADLALFGDPNASTYSRDSLRGKTHELSLALTGRGRVWSGGTITADGENRVFQFAAARSKEEADKVKLENVLMYAFADGNVAGQAYPQSYIGTVMVAAETPAQVTLKPVFIADGQQWTEPATSWSLYEKMPLDRHDIFKDAIVAYVDANKDTAAEGLQTLAADILKGEMKIGPYRQLLVTQYLPAEKLGFDPASVEYQKLIDQYAFDGFSIGDIKDWIEANPGSRVVQTFDPPPEEVFYRYRFKKASSQTYTVNSEAGTLETDGPFTELGYAVDPLLHADGPVKFEEGDTVLVDQLSSQAFVQKETDATVEKIDEVYFRQLRDFPYMFSDLTLQTRKFMEETERVKATIVVQIKALEDAAAQREDRLRTIAGLQFDNSNLKNDTDAIQGLQNQREEEIRTLTAQIASLKQQIQQNYQRVQELSRNIERQVYAGR